MMLDDASDGLDPPRLRGELHARQGRFVLDTGAFDWPLAGVTALFGPSGSGKSTLLRAIAGLVPQLRGRLEVGAEVWLDGSRQLAPQRRAIGYVFQDAALFPHLSVRGNLDFAGRRAAAAGAAPQAGFDAVEATGIGHLLERGVGALSGGERQRVAIARALLSRPRLLLLDEPFAALDWRSRDELLDVVERVTRDRRLPLLMVSHSPEEVERLADRVALVEGGRLRGFDTLQQVLARTDSPLFDRLGAVSVIEGHARALQPGLASFGIGAERLTIPGRADAAEGPARVRVYARDVALARREPTGLSMLNHLPARVESLGASRPGHVLVRLRLDDGQGLWSEITEPAVASLGLEAGAAVVALVKTASLQR